MNNTEKDCCFTSDKNWFIYRAAGIVVEDGGIERNSAVANFATTAIDGKTYQVDYYSG